MRERTGQVALPNATGEALDLTVDVETPDAPDVPRVVLGISAWPDGEERSIPMPPHAAERLAWLLVQAYEVARGERER